MHLCKLLMIFPGTSAAPIDSIMKIRPLLARQDQVFLRHVGLLGSLLVLFATPFTWAVTNNPTTRKVSVLNGFKFVDWFWPGPIQGSGRHAPLIYIGYVFLALGALSAVLPLLAIWGRRVRRWLWMGNLALAGFAIATLYRNWSFVREMSHILKTVGGDATLGFGFDVAVLGAVLILGSAVTLLFAPSSVPSGVVTMAEASAANDVTPVVQSEYIDAGTSVDNLFLRRRRAVGWSAMGIAAAALVIGGIAIATNSQHSHSLVKGSRSTQAGKNESSTTLRNQGVSGVLNSGGDASVDAVSCVSTSFCAAGGRYTDSSGQGQAFVSVYNGTSWSDHELAAGPL